MTTTFLTAAGLLALYMCCMFFIGLRARDNSLIDIAYGPAFIFAGWGTWLMSDTDTTHLRPLLLLALLTLWGLRLGLHIGLRHRGQGEDFRYQKFRRDWGNTIIWRSFLQIYMLQGAVVLVIATPVLLTIGAPGPPLQWTDLLGSIIFAVGFLFEAVSDYQLTAFKKGGAAKGKIIMHGLWRYSRHPNYFGEALLWWGIFLIGLAAPWGLYGLISPLAIAFLLLKVSGIPMLEVKYRNNPRFCRLQGKNQRIFSHGFRVIPATAQHPRRDLDSHDRQEHHRQRQNRRHWRRRGGHCRRPSPAKKPPGDAFRAG
jgi:steroid 5-alpha reductase family enzyme